MRERRYTWGRGKRTVKSRTAGVSTAGEIQIKFFWVTKLCSRTWLPMLQKNLLPPETARFHLHDDHKLKSRSVFGISVSAAFWNVSRTKPNNRKHSHRTYFSCITNLTSNTAYTFQIRWPTLWLILTWLHRSWLSRVYEKRFLCRGTICNIETPRH